MRIVLVLAQSTMIHEVLSASDLLYDFPEKISMYNVRKDKHTNSEVVRGRLHELGIKKMNQRVVGKKFSYAFLMRHLQCDSSLPDMNSRGSVKMLQMVPLTRSRAEIICAWAESSCSPWTDCQHLVETNKKGGYNQELKVPGFYGFRDFRLLRVTNNTLYNDWPWGMERFEGSLPDLRVKLVDHYMLLQMVLNVVSDMKDSLFFFGHERSILPWNVPFPGFSFAPQLGYSDFPFPFVEMYKTEYEYENHASQTNNYSDANYVGRNHLDWNKRLAKAAFFASLDSPQPRQLIYDQAVLRPDLFDASFSSNGDSPWNPSSNESTLSSKDIKEIRKSINVPERQHPGYAQYITELWTNRRYTPGHYKYVIVPAGSGVLSLSGRIANLLAHSGAVILLQDNSFYYHFSIRFKPWVHYVPLAYNMADATDKIEWLIAHDDMAQRIAKNGLNFGKSYLRVEDYYCYAANSMQMLGDMQEGTDVIKSFNATQIPTDLFYSN